jgi:hypothetical protein
MAPNLTPFQRTFVQDVKRCEEMERRLRFLSEQIAKVRFGRTRAHAMWTRRISRTTRTSTDRSSFRSTIPLPKSSSVVLAPRRREASSAQPSATLMSSTMSSKASSASFSR